MNLCILGDKIFEKEILFLKNSLEKDYNIVFTPTLKDYDEKDYDDSSIKYKEIRDIIKMSDYIVLVIEFKNNSFMFYFGMCFGLNKKFKTVYVNDIDKIIEKNDRGVY